MHLGLESEEMVATRDGCAEMRGPSRPEWGGEGRAGPSGPFPGSAGPASPFPGRTNKALKTLSPRPYSAGHTVFGQGVTQNAS